MPVLAACERALGLLSSGRVTKAPSREEPPMPRSRKRMWKIIVAALVGIPWIPIAVALYAWAG